MMFSKVRGSAARVAGWLAPAVSLTRAVSLAAAVSLLSGTACGPKQAAPVLIPLAEPAPNGNLDAVAFMQGSWMAVVDGPASDSGGPTRITVEEWWSIDTGGTMLGHSRTTTGGETVFFEHLALIAAIDGVVYRAQPKGALATEFWLTEATPGMATFTDTENDYPKRIRYWQADGGLRACIDDGAGGMESCWDYAREMAGR